LKNVVAAPGAAHVQLRDDARVRTAAVEPRIAERRRIRLRDLAQVEPGDVPARDVDVRAVARVAPIDLIPEETRLLVGLLEHDAHGLLVERNRAKCQSWRKVPATFTCEYVSCPRRSSDARLREESSAFDELHSLQWALAVGGKAPEPHVDAGRAALDIDVVNGGHVEPNRITLRPVPRPNRRSKHRRDSRTREQNGEARAARPAGHEQIGNRLPRRVQPSGCK
jgi:hypothetical protein